MPPVHWPNWIATATAKLPARNTCPRNVATRVAAPASAGPGRAPIARMVSAAQAALAQGKVVRTVSAARMGPAKGKAGLMDSGARMVPAKGPVAQMVSGAPVAPVKADLMVPPTRMAHVPDVRIGAKLSSAEQYSIEHSPGG